MNILNDYKQEIKAIPRLDSQRQKELFENGDQNEMMKAFLNFVVGFIYRKFGSLMRDQNQALDLIQEANLILYKVLKKELKDLRPETFNAYLRIHLKYGLINYLKKNKSNISLDKEIMNRHDSDNEPFYATIEDKTAKNPEEVAIKNILFENLYKAIDKLTEKQKQVIVKRFNLDGENYWKEYHERSKYDGFNSYGEKPKPYDLIAQEIGSERVAVLFLCQRALRALKVFMTTPEKELPISFQIQRDEFGRFVNSKAIA